MAVAGVLLAAVLAGGLVYYFLSPGESANPAVSGSVSYDDQFELPQDAKLVIQLRDVTESGKAGELVAEEIIADLGRPPVAFRLGYDLGLIDADRVYGLSASVRDAQDEPLLTSDDIYRVITGGYPLEVAMELTAVRRLAPDGSVATPPTGRLEGSVDYDDDVSLPEGSELVVRLQRSGGELIAEQVIANPGRPPFSYELTYDVNELAEETSYTVTGRISGPDGETILANRHPQITVGRDYLHQISDLVLLPAESGHDAIAAEPDAAIEVAIAYASSSGLPRDSVLIVQLRDVTDGAAESVIEQRVENPGSSPVRFRIDYFAADFSQTRLYSVSATIYDAEGRLLFINDTERELVVRGLPPRIDMRLLEV